MIGGLDARVCVAMCSHSFKVNTSLIKQGLIPELMGGETQGEGGDLGRRKGIEENQAFRESGCGMVLGLSEMLILGS